MYPSLFDLRPHTPHAKTAVPAVAPNNEWDDFETKVVRTLKDFYTGRMKHGFTIPAAEKEEHSRLRRIDELARLRVTLPFALPVRLPGG